MEPTIGVEPVTCALGDRTFKLHSGITPVLGRCAGRRVTPHCLRHTFASLHIARGTNLLWIQEAGGWASAKMLLDVYGHFMPTESAGFADAITAPGIGHTSWVLA